VTLATWPSGKQAWTVVVATASDRAAAEKRAADLASQGVKVGVLDKHSYTVDAPGSFVVFSGQFSDQNAAVAEEQRIGSKLPSGAFVAQVSPA
jgi:hypothetical protein